MWMCSKQQRFYFSFTSLICAFMVLRGETFVCNGVQYALRGETPRGIVAVKCLTNIMHDVVLPREINGYPLVGIGEMAFDDCAAVHSLTLPDTVRFVGYRAFSGSGITNVFLPSGITNIGFSAFLHCKELTHIKMPDTVSIISSHMFLGCTKLTTVIIGAKVREIEEDAFFLCGKLAEIAFPDRLDTIGQTAFGGAGLSSIVLPESVTNIGFAAFGACTNLKQAVFNGNNFSLPSNLFIECSSLEKVVFKGSVTSIGEWAFMGCARIKEIHFTGLPPLLKGKEIFKEDNNLTIYYSCEGNKWSDTFGGRPTKRSH